MHGRFLAGQATRNAEGGLADDVAVERLALQRGVWHPVNHKSGPDVPMFGKLRTGVPFSWAMWLLDRAQPGKAHRRNTRSDEAA